MQNEVKLLEPMWHGGKPLEPGAVIALGHAEAVYLTGIGRVEILPAEGEPAPAKKPARKGKAD